eukprot:COSAG01_NODE_12723_length_1693_cov_6.143664_3_plen_116_part_00
MVVLRLLGCDTSVNLVSQPDHGEYGQEWQGTVLSYTPTSPRAADGACASTTSTGERGAGGSSPSAVALASLRDCELGFGEPIRADRILDLHFSPSVNSYSTRRRFDSAGDSSELF